MDFGRLTQRNALVIGAVLLLLVLVGFYVFLLGPLREELGERQEEREAKQRQLDELEAEIARLEDIQSRAPQIERELLELSRRVPEQPRIPTLTVQLQEIAEEAGVTQLLLQPGDPVEPEDGGDYTIIPVTMSFEGGYGELQNFLLRLRNLTRLVAVESVVYEAVEEEDADTGQGGGAEEEPTLQIELGAEVYAQPGEGGIQTNDAPETAGDEAGGDEDAGSGPEDTAEEGTNAQ